MSLTRAERAVLRERFTEVETAASMLASEVAGFRFALEALDRRILAEPVRARRGVAVVPPGDHAPARVYPKGIRRERHADEVVGGKFGDVAESMREAIVAEVRDFLVTHPGVYRTSEIVRASPTLSHRYRSDQKHLVAALGGILRSMGSRHGIRNVSANTRARWQYIGVVQEMQA